MLTLASCFDHKFAIFGHLNGKILLFIRLTSSSPAAPNADTERLDSKTFKIGVGESMEFRIFGSTRRAVPIIGQGTWNIESGSRNDAVAALRRGIDLGMTHIDTAEMYGSGDAESLVGQAIAGRREQIFLVSKVLPQNASREGTVRACEQSLARLKTGYLDCYLLHWRGRHPLEQTVAAFVQLQNQGKILSWGVSNFDIEDLEQVWAIADGGNVACNQVLYHLAERAIEHAVVPWCREHGVAVVGYSPFGHGEFPGPRTAGGKVLAQIAAAHRATPRQVALRFLTREPELFTIPKASTVKHAVENAEAGDLTLTQAEIAQIDKAFPLGPRPTQLPML
jgi:diketogulonate reductase-like aldo/keto reductase